MINETDDNLLLQKIALRKDHDAFQKLYQRYERYAFSIALRILGKQSLAEEAIQEAFLGIWSSAASYRPNKNHHPRYWIMAIVVNNCLRINKTQRRQERNAKQETERSCKRAPSSAPEELERAELLTALHQKLIQIPADSRLVLTLFYGAGMTQKDIAKSVSMPPRTVSFKIQETLKWLRGELAKSKLSGVVPVLSAEIMQAACGDGYQPPPGLQERVLANLSNEVNVTSAAKIGGTFPKTPALVASVLIAAVCIAVGVNHFTGKPIQTATPTNEATTEQPKLLRHWDFNQPDLSALNVIEGTWEHLPQGGPDGSGYMTVPNSPNVRFEINVPLTDLPVRLQFKAKFKQAKADYLLSWGDQVPQVALQRAQLGKVERGKPGWKTYRCFISKQGLEFWHNGILAALLLTKANNQNDLILRFARDTRIDDLEIHKIDPTTINYSAPYFQAAENYAAAQSVVPMLIPALCSGPTSTFPHATIWKAVAPNAPEFSGIIAKTWTFKDPNELLDFAVVEGQWKHIPKGGKDGTGCVEMAKGNSTSLFDLNAERYPFLITARYRIFDPLSGFPEIIWRPNDAPLQANFFNAFPNPKIIISPSKPWIRIKLFVTRAYTDYWAQNRRVALVYNPKPRGAFGSIVSRVATQMDYLSIRPLRTDQLPDLGPFAAAIEKIQKTRKSGILPLPHFNSPIPGKKVFAEITFKKADDTQPNK